MLPSQNQYVSPHYSISSVIETYSKLNFFLSLAFLGNADPAAGRTFVASLGKKLLGPGYVGHDETPSCAMVSIPTPKTVKSGATIGSAHLRDEA